MLFRSTNLGKDAGKGACGRQAKRVCCGPQHVLEQPADVRVPVRELGALQERQPAEHVRQRVVVPALVRRAMPAAMHATGREPRVDRLARDPLASLLLHPLAKKKKKTKQIMVGALDGRVKGCVR